MDDEKQREISDLLQREQDFLRTQARSLASSNEDAEDLVQDTVLKAFKGYESFQPDTNFRAWIGRIMLNTHINNFNRSRNRTSVSCDFSSGECDNVAYHAPADASRGETDSPEKIFFYNYVDERLVEFFYSLPDSYRIPFYLFHLEGYSYDEIADSLRIPIGTVKSRIFRARQNMKDKILAGGGSRAVA